MTLAEALAQCRAEGVDARVSGRGVDACMNRIAPFCPEGVTVDTSHELPRCAQPAPSAAKAAILLKEAQARVVVAPKPWLLIGVGVAGAGLVLWWVLR